MSKRRILIVYHFIAGYRESIFNELKLNSNNVEFHFASDVEASNDVVLIPDSFYNSKRFKRLNNVWVLGGLWQAGLFKLLTSEKYDAVIFLADPSFFSTWLAAAYLKFKSTKVLFWTHGFIRGRSSKDILKLLFYKLADSLLLYGNGAKVNLVAYGVPEKKLFSIYNSLDYEKQKKIRENISLEDVQDKKYEIFKKPSNFQLIFVGRLTPPKKLNAVIDMVSKLKVDRVFVNLLIVGDGVQKKELETQVYTQGISNQVAFYGKTYDEEELALLLMGSNLCVSPGEIGLTAMHVLAYGVPVITHGNEFTQMPEYEAVIDGETGYLFPDGDYEEMGRLVKDMINNPIENIRVNCIGVIESKYNPVSQKKFILEALDGLH